MTTKEYKSFMTEGFSIGAHAESLYSRGYKHYGTMGQGNKAVHIFTPAHPGKNTPAHHMLLKHDGADPVRHEGAPDLKKIKAMTEAVDVQAIQKERETKAQRKDRNIQTQNVKEALPSNAKAGDYIDDFVHSKNKMFKGDSKKQRIKRALGAYYGHQKEDVESIFEGWLFGDRYTKIGNRGATHRITFSHTKMNNKKHTVDVTAPTDQHAINHVHRYVSGGNYSAPIKVLKIQHLHEGAVEDALAKQRASIEGHAERIKQAKLDNTKNISGPIQRTVRKLEKNHAWQPKTPDKPFRKKRIDTLIKNSQQTKNEDLSEALDIRHAINHPDSQARHHARKFRDHSKTANDIANMRVFPDQAYDYAHHYTAAIHHAKEYRKRLGQLEAGKNVKESKETEKPHPKGTRVVVSHKGHQKVGKVIRHDPGGPDSSPFYIVDVGEYGSGKFMAHHVRKEDLDEAVMSGTTYAAISLAARQRRAKESGDNTHSSDDNDKPSFKRRKQAGELKVDYTLSKDGTTYTPIVRNSKKTKKEDLSEGGFMLTAAHKIKTRIKNAVKNANKKLKPTAQRIADTRKKVGYDNAKGKDLSPRGNALRRVEKIEWAKMNPVKKKKDIVPMGKLPDKVWETAEELEPKDGDKKFLKEKPKRDPMTGKLAKSKTAQKVEDCIKMSGKKEKIDTEPSYNPFTTAGGGGTPNA